MALTNKVEGARDLAFLLSEVGDISFETVTIAAGSVYPPAAVLGQASATKKFAWSTATGSDGLQTSCAVLAYGVDASAADAPGVVVRRLAEVKGKQLVYGATINDNTKKSAANDQLAASNIIVR